MAQIITRIDHTAIAAENTAAMVDWYQRVLGFRIVAETTPAAPQSQKAYLVGPAGDIHHGSMFEIMPRNSNPRINRASHDAGISHVAFYVPDFDAALAHLRQEHVQFLGEVVQALGGGRLISFADCEGNMLQIVERL
jgi:glyoxylase I family protein